MVKRLILLVISLSVLLSGCAQNAPSPTATPTPAPPVTKDGPAMVFVPAGEFTMGDSILVDEMPVHKVTLDAVMRTAKRRYIAPDETGGYLGFRCAK